MIRCRNGTYRLPKCEQINPIQCVEPPPKQVIFSELQSMLQERGRTMGLKHHMQLEAKYMLTMIATLEPDHQWFTKGWIYRPIRPARVQQAEPINNDDDYYTGLPKPKKPSKRGRAKDCNTKPVLDEATLTRRRLKQEQK